MSEHQKEECDPNLARVMAMIIHSLKEKIDSRMDRSNSFAQQYILQKGLKIFKERGQKAATKEVKQLHDHACWEPIDISTMTQSEKRKVVEAMLLLTEKRDGTVKGRAVHNGKPTRAWLNKDKCSSPAVSMESLCITAIIDALEARDIMTNDIPNAFIQTNMPTDPDEKDRVIMKISGVLVDMLVELSPEEYGPYVVIENGKKVLCVRILKALCGMLAAALLWYKNCLLYTSPSPRDS